MSLLRALLAIFFPPLAVIDKGCGSVFIVLLLTLCGWVPGVDPAILDPRDTYADAAQWEEKALDLAGRFIKNFTKYTGNEAGKALVAAGPKL